MTALTPRGGVLSALLGVLLFELLALPLPAAALSEGAWVTTHAETAIYAHADRDEVLSFAPQWASFRVDGPAIDGRIWVWSPYSEGRGWIPAQSVGPGAPPTVEGIQAFWDDLWRDQVLQQRVGSARDYLYAKYPNLAPLLDCIAQRESNWRNVPNATGSGAFGPFQFMQGTFFTTPTGRAGGDWRSPHDQVDAAAEMLRAGRLYEWSVVGAGLC